MGRERRVTDWKVVENRERARERTEWAKELRLPSTTTAERHTETRDRRAHHHDSSNHRIFSGFFIGQALITSLVHTLLDFVVWLCCMPFMGNDPPQFSGTW